MAGIIQLIVVPDAAGWRIFFGRSSVPPPADSPESFPGARRSGTSCDLDHCGRLERIAEYRTNLCDYVCVTQALIAITAIVVGWSLMSAKFVQWGIAPPVVIVLSGVAVGFTTVSQVSETLNTQVALRAAELILAVLLFVDATEVRGGLLGGQPWLASRLLFIALPVSLAVSVLLGLWLLTDLSWAVLLVLACVVVPTDFAPATWILRDREISPRVRNVLNVESGYNDGIVSPIFIFALVLAGNHSQANTPVDALAAAAPSALKALFVGVGVGVVLALSTNTAEQRNSMSEQAKRVALVAAPIMTFALATSIHGNGFVASFVCGIVLSYLRRSPDFGRQLELLDDIGFVLTAAMWFVFGVVAVFAMTTSITWSLIGFCLAALTVVRIVPVLLATIRTRLSRSDRLLAGVLGPRGTTTIVFGLLAFNQLDGQAADTAITATVFVVLGSVVLHGAGWPLLTHARRRFRPDSSPDGSVDRETHESP